jgi:hypothetical protein
MQRFSLVSLVLAAALGAQSIGCAVDPADDAPEALTDDEARALTDTFVSVRPDLRRCAYPTCGGFWISWVNRATTVCADGRSASECYVATIDLAHSGLPESQRDELVASFRDSAVSNTTILRGRIRAATTDAPVRFDATDVFRTDAPIDSTASIVFANASASCSFQPCTPSRMGTANSTRSRTPASIDFSRAAGSAEAHDLAQLGGTAESGVLVRGTLARALPDGSRVFNAAQFFLHVNPAPAAPVCGDGVNASVSYATERLLFTSESDYPFTSVNFAGAARNGATADAVRTAAGITDGVAVETRTMDDFFGWRAIDDASATLGERSVAARYRVLRRALESNLTDLHVYRFGSIQIRVFIVGRDACGNLVGVETTSIET